MKKIHQSRFKTLLYSQVGILVLLLVCFMSYAYFLSGLRVEPPPYRIDWSIHPAIVFESDDWGKVQLFDNRGTLDESVYLLPSDSTSNLTAIMKKPSH